jgi:hypothetical protein
MSAKATAKIDPAAVYIAIQAFAHTYGDVRLGARLRGSHEVVQKFWPYFALDGSDDAAMAQQRAELHPDVERPDPTRTHLPRPLADEDALLCLKPVPGIANRGEKLDRRASEVAKAARENPGSLVPVSNGVRRADAVVATEAMRCLNADGSTAYEITPRLWYPRDHPAVRSSPSLFKLPEPAP